MTFVTGILIWLALGVAAGLLVRAFYRGPTTTTFISVCFGIFGALVGGMLGVAGSIAHEPHPLSVGGMIGAILGATLFSFIYHGIARKAL